MKEAKKSEWSSFEYMGLVYLRVSCTAQCFSWSIIPFRGCLQLVLRFILPVGGEAASPRLPSSDLSPNLTCHAFLCLEGGFVLCFGSCWLLHSILSGICKGPSLWSECSRQLDQANWCCVWASVHNVSFDSCASSTRPTPSNKKKDRRHQRLSPLDTNDMGSVCCAVVAHTHSSLFYLFFIFFKCTNIHARHIHQVIVLLLCE